jgi:hypothetical protein
MVSFNPVEWLKQAWQKRPVTTVSVSALALIFAAVSAFTDVHSLFSSPEKQLTELGYPERNYDEFLRAIANKHIEAVELFGEIGKRLKPEQFHELFLDAYFNAGVLDALLDAKSVTDEHCPTSGQRILVYIDSASNPQKMGFIRKLCANEKVVAALEASLQAEQARLTDAEDDNTARNVVLRACDTRYQQEGEERMIRDAAQFSLTGTNAYTERECVLAKLNVGLITSDPRLRAGQQYFNDAVTGCCDHYNPEAKIDFTQRENLERAIKLLK